MNHKITLFGILVSLLVLSGCTTLIGGGVSSQETIEDFRTGTKSVTIEFIDGLPTKELLENSLFSVGITLHNEGATNIRNGKVLLTYDEDYLTFFSSTNTFFELEGKSQFNKDGEERAYFFEGKSSYLDRESSSRDVSISSTACFEYESVFVDLVCLDRPYTGDTETGNPVCTPRDLRSSGQGGPVYISNVELSSIENNVGVKPFFDIEVSHRDKGLVIHPQVYDTQCSRASSVNALNKVVIQSATISDVGLDCNKREVTLIDGKAKFRCTTFAEIVPTRLPFEAPLQIELSYGYSTSKSFETTIIR